MKKKKPLASFVIRTKNEGVHIEKVLKALETQTVKDFEIIVIDSGSTDKTLEIVKKFPVRLMKIKPEEFSYSHALNLGISKARGKYIGIISGHSLPLTDTWLEDGLKNFKKGNVAGVTGYMTGFPLGYFSRRMGRLFFFPYQRKVQNYCPWMTNTNSLIRKDLWKKYPFDENLKEGCEDYDWAVEMLSRKYSIVKDPKFAVVHSHFLIDKPSYYKRRKIWNRVCKTIEAKKRPSKSHAKLETN